MFTRNQAFAHRTVIGVLAVAVLSFIWMIPGPSTGPQPARFAFAQAPPDRPEGLEDDREAIERQLDELEQAIEKAEELGDNRRLEELRTKAEPLFDRLDAIEREQGDEEVDRGDFEREELEEREQFFHHREMELALQRAEIETSMMQLERVGRLIDIAEDSTTAAAYAVMHLQEFVERERAADLLTGLLDRVEDTTLRRIIRMQLAQNLRELDRPGVAAEQLEALILEK